MKFYENCIDDKLISEINTLVETTKTVYISSIDKNGYPNTKAMLALQHDGLFTHYFSTNLSAKRTAQFKENPKCCVYFCDDEQFKGLMLLGNMEVCTDREHRTMLWREGFEIYYPKGIDDEDYCVLKFTAAKGNYYHGLDNLNFNERDII